MVKLGFDLDEVEESQGFDLIPAGQYEMCPVRFTLKSTKSGNGEFLEVEFDIVSGDHSGRKVWDRFHFSNPSEKAVTISRSKFKKLALGCGRPVIDDTDDLIGDRCIGVVTIKGDDHYGPKNEIKDYRPLEKTGGHSAPPATRSSSSAPPATHSNAPAERKPWQR